MLLPFIGNNQMDVKQMTAAVGQSFESRSFGASGESLNFTSNESGQLSQTSKECRKNDSEVSHVVRAKKRSDQVSLFQIRVLLLWLLLKMFCYQIFSNPKLSKGRA